MPDEPALRQPSTDPWRVAWMLLAPLLAVLLLAKWSRVLSAMVWTSAPPLDDSSLRGVASWLWTFTSLRFAGALLVAWLVQRLVLPRRPLLVVPLAALFFWGLALAVGLARREANPLRTVWHWTATASEQFLMLVACVWRDALIVSACVLLLGLLLWLLPQRVRPWIVRGAQALVVLACLLVAIDYVQELATGQPTNTRVVVFALAHPVDLFAILRQELTPYRAAVLGGAVLLALGWAWRHRALASPWPAAVRRPAPLALGAAVAGTAAMLLPVPPIDANQRDTASTLYSLARTARPVPEDRIRTDVAEAYARTGQAPWSSADLVLVPTAPTAPARKKNVVIFMLESVRAVATSLHTPGLATTPYLQSLAAQGLLVEDMSAVIPRTAAAWMAILGGQYPLTNEGTAIWAAERGRGAPALRGLPGALGKAGYATSYFSPAHISFLNDRELLGALGFESVFTDKDLHDGDAPNVNYFGPADEVMVEPIMTWTRKQVAQRRPFMTAVMTNVGHHPYQPPSHWQRIDFGQGAGARANAQLNDYYNCLRYVDGVLASIMQGYERLGVLQDTVFVFVGDHGQMFGEHGLKQSFNSIYQEGLHVPAVIYAPGLVAPGQVARGARQQIDILPTVLELLGMRAEGARLPGQSLLHPVAPGRELFFSSSIEWTYLAMRRNGRKYIYSFDREPLAVFDLAQDRTESRPVDGVPEAEIGQARQRMIEWKAQAEISAYGQPSRSYRPTRSWSETLQPR